MSDGLVSWGCWGPARRRGPFCLFRGVFLGGLFKGVGGMTVRAGVLSGLRMACRGLFKGLDCAVTHPRCRICHRLSIGLVEDPLDGLSRGGWCDWSCACFSGP